MVKAADGRQICVSYKKDV